MSKKKSKLNSMKRIDIKIETKICYINNENLLIKIKNYSYKLLFLN